ncbi:MAG: hypothetical protein V2A79_12520 [Planctomycetota bacterium]
MGDIIGIHGFFRTLPVGDRRPAEGPRPGRYATPGMDFRTAAASADHVEFSTLGRFLSRITETAYRTTEPPANHPGRIDRIRADIATDTYESPAKMAVVIDRLLEQFQ